MDLVLGIFGVKRGMWDNCFCKASWRSVSHRDNRSPSIWLCVYCHSALGRVRRYVLGQDSVVYTGLRLVRKRMKGAGQTMDPVSPCCRRRHHTGDRIEPIVQRWAVTAQHCGTSMRHCVRRRGSMTRRNHLNWIRSRRHKWSTWLLVCDSDVHIWPYSGRCSICRRNRARCSVFQSSVLSNQQLRYTTLNVG
jgi:hypothetical protein